ncbi:DNRLRE domain-containing protein [Actinoplanes oblitus]|uniref:DNRLRE domain-containing protein n=1 Tax=Actinoplanes oblitus TaxID=3040509 RepID=A0ABY8WCB5_9ACTN|nr:DNRLRE domain-containing protein [Actinoplanes oblitus]WIM95012.1 DNRLRE domain-containing protein [Actinoplanes oblitus]
MARRVRAERRMPVRLDSRRLTIAPAQQLLSDPGTIFPVYIDPGLSLNRAGFAVVNSAAPDTSFWNPADDAFVGSWDGGTSRYRSFFSVDLTSTPLADQQIRSATLDLQNIYSATCQPASFEVWSTGVPTAETTWNNQPAWYRGRRADCRSLHTHGRLRLHQFGIPGIHRERNAGELHQGQRNRQIVRPEQALR